VGGIVRVAGTTLRAAQAEAILHRTVQMIALSNRVVQRLEANASFVRLGKVKGVVDRLNCLVRIGLLHNQRNVQFRRALCDRDHIDVCLGDR